MCYAEPGTQYHRPAARSLFHRTPTDNGFGSGGSPSSSSAETHGTMQHGEPGSGQGVTGDNAMETFALILAPAHGTTSPPEKTYLP